MARVSRIGYDLEVALDRLITPIDATARDNGHDPHTWTIDRNGPGLAAHTACRKCGRTAAVRVRVGHNPWSAGDLRYADCR